MNTLEKTIIYQETMEDLFTPKGFYYPLCN